jgi:hypothetical protein
MAGGLAEWLRHFNNLAVGECTPLNTYLDNPLFFGNNWGVLIKLMLAKQIFLCFPYFKSNAEILLLLVSAKILL